MTRQADEVIENARMIKESAAFLSAPEKLKAVRANRYGLPGFDRDEWSSIATGMGWLGLRVEEKSGGLGLGLSEFCALAEALGGGLAPAPWLAAIAVAPRLRGELLAEALSGRRIVLPAWQESPLDDGSAAATSLRAGRISGRKRFVPMGMGADAFVVSTDRGLATVEAAGEGVLRDAVMLQDGCHQCDVVMRQAPAEPIDAAWGDTGRELALACAAYLLGVARTAFSITADYVRTRKQFGQPIGSFQSLQHRMVDLYLQIELTEAAVGKAARSYDQDPLGGGVAIEISRAKARASDAAMLVTRQGVQLHGAIGFTDEADIGLFLRKAMVLAHAHGTATAHRMKVAEAMAGSMAR